MAERKVIHHPQEPHRPHTISARHFDPAKHRLWGEPEAEPEVEEKEIEQVEQVEQVEEEPRRAPKGRKGAARG